MNTRRLLALLVLLGLMSLAFGPLGQEEPAPPRPTIQIGVSSQPTVSEEVFAYCWPVSANDNQCGFEAQPSPVNIVQIESGQTLQVFVSGGPGTPSAVTATVSGGAGGERAFNLEPAEQTFFDVQLGAGTYDLDITAVYDDVLGSQAWVSHIFRLEVFVSAGGAEPLVPTQESFATEAPTQEVAVVVTEEATEVITEAPTEVATEAPTQEVAVVVTEEATEAAPEAPTEAATEAPTEVATEAPTEAATEQASPEATEAPTEAATEVPTEAATEAPTEAATEAPTEAATEAPTEAATEAPTEAATEVATEAPTEVATEAPTEATEAPTEAATEAPTEAATEAPPDGPRPTFTTVPLQVPSEPPPPPPPPPITQPEEIPNMQLVFAGRIFDPVGVNFCQRSAANQLTCVESPLPSDSPTVELLRNFAVQIRLVDGPRPASIGFTFLNANTLQSVQAESRAGDRLVLFNIRPAPGVYFLRVSVDWNGTNADYFFRVRINP